MNIRIKNRKAEWYARDWIIATLFFSGVIALLFIMGTDLENTYNRQDLIDQNFNNKYNAFQNSTESIAEMFSATTGKGGLTPLDVGQAIFSSTFTVIQLIFASIGVFNSQIANAASDIGIPTPIAVIIMPLFIAVITVLLIFIITTSQSRNRI